MRPEEQTPLQPRGLASAPKFLEDSQNKFLANEDENAYVQLEVFGDPAPKVQWFRGELDLSEFGRFKFWTDGARNLVFMGIESCTKADEGVYRCLITNRFGRREHKFKLFISRSFRKKGPPKKREVPLYWSEVPRSKFIKQGTVEKVSFTSKLTVSDQTAKWYFKEMPCFNGEKYGITQGGGTFSIVINNPSPEDTGCYKCVLDNMKELFCETYLDVQPPDPEYNFLKLLPSTLQGYIGRPLKLSCLCSEDAQVSWFMDKQEINQEDEHLKTSTYEGEHILEIAHPYKNDSAKYSCCIIKFGKEGECETACNVNITEFHHRFAKQLPECINLVERDNLLLQATTKETFATVKWLKDGKELNEGRKRNQRVKLFVREGLHCLAIEGCTPEDQGTYTAATNKDTTSCAVIIADYPYKFAKKLDSVTRVTEDDKVTFEVEVEDEEAEVTWFHDNAQFELERSRLARIQVESKDKKRLLTIKKCMPEDAANIIAKTNADYTSTDFIVKCHNSFSERLFETAECGEHCRMEFHVQVKDKTAPVFFVLNKCPVDIEDKRFLQEDLGQGRHLLVITKVSKEDEGILSCKTPTNRGKEMIECRCIFNVTEGESPPLIGKVEPVSCVSHLHSNSDRMNSYIQKEACRLVIPYKIEGTRKSNLDILIEKEGQEVEIGEDIQMKVRSDRVMIDILNQQRGHSGVYRVILSNDQGSCEVDVPVEVLDIPLPPMEVSVQEVRKNSVTIQWKAPEDDGGSPIKHFVTEVLNFTTNNIWTSVAMTDTGDCTEQELEHLIEGHRYCFRVAAVNRLGQSEPREIRGEVVTKDPWDVPSSCGKPYIVDWTPTFVDLSWSRPSSDGGSPVTNFIIEVRESSIKQWIDGTVIPIEEITIDGDCYRGRCNNLQEEYEYKFRVVAVNRAGKSNPSSASDSIIAMHKYVAPYIKGEGLKDINIKEGKGFRFDLWVGGEPVPTIEWYRDDLRITNDDTTSLDVYTKSSSAYTLKNTVLSIPKAIEDIHGGVYKLRLKNDGGIFESVVTVNIDGPAEKRAKKLAEEKEKAEKEAIENLKENSIEEDKKEASDENKGTADLDDEEECESEYTYTYTDDEDSDVEENLFEIATSNNIIIEEEVNNDDNYISNDIENEENCLISTKVINEELDNGQCGDSIQLQDETAYKNDDIDISREIFESNFNENDQKIDDSENTKQREEDIEQVNAESSYEKGTESQKENIYNLDENAYFKNGKSTFDQNESLPDTTCVINKDEISTEGDQNSTEDDLIQSEIYCDELVEKSYNETSSENGKTIIDQNESLPIPDTSCIINGDKLSIEGDQNNREDYIRQNEFCCDELAEKSDNGTNSGAGSNIIAEEISSKIVEKNIENKVNPQVKDLSGDIFENIEVNMTYDTQDLNEIQSEIPYKNNENQRGISEDKHLTQRKEDDISFTPSGPKKIEEDGEQVNAPSFNAKEHLCKLQTQLDLKLKSTGFSKSATMPEEMLSVGDKCLIALLDQMNRDDQDFKVWDRDDYSFLRWYITKQMETLHEKGENIKFTEAIEGDVQAYIEKMSNDGVPLDRAFLQAAATIFNKDIILIPSEGDTDFDVIVGGLSGPRSKGDPLYLGHIKQTENNSDIFISVMPDQNDSKRIASILTGDLVKADAIVVNEQNNKEENLNEALSETAINVEDEEDGKLPVNEICEQWKRMDSYSSSESKDLDQIIQDIQNQDDLKEILLNDADVEDVIIPCFGSSEQWKRMDSYNGSATKELNQTIQDINDEEIAYQDQHNKLLTNKTNKDKHSSEMNTNLIMEIDCIQNIENSLPMEDEEFNIQSEKESEFIGKNHEDKSKESVIYNEKQIVNWEDNLLSTTFSQQQSPEVQFSDTIIEGNEKIDEQQSESIYENLSNPFSSLEENSAKFSNDVGSEEIICDTNSFHKPLENLESIDVYQSSQDMESEHYSDSYSKEIDNFFHEVSVIPIDLEAPQHHEKDSESVSPSSEIEVDNVSTMRHLENQRNDSEQFHGIVTNNFDTLAFSHEKEPKEEVSNETDNKSQKLNITEEQSTNADKKIRRIKVKATISRNDRNNEINSNEEELIESSTDTVDVTNSDEGKSKRMESLSKDDTTEKTIVLKDNILTNKSDSGLNCEGYSKYSCQSNNSYVEKIGTTDPSKKIEDEETKIPIEQTKTNDENMQLNLKTKENDIDQEASVVHIENESTREVKMRPPLQKYSKKKTASYRWSGTEMMQIDGPPEVADTNSEKIEVKQPSKDLLNATRANISYKKTSAALDKKLKKHGFTRSPTCKELYKDGDNCLKALIDQMSQPGQDFKVWDRDDFSFLRWYIAKQLEIHVSAGKAENYVKANGESPNEYVAHIQKDEEFVDNDFLYSVAKIFNKDIIIVESSNQKEGFTYIKGGPNDMNGKGKPIFLGHLAQEEAGHDFYQSILPNEDFNIEVMLSSS